jgi:urease beta subunit
MKKKERGSKGAAGRVKMADKVKAKRKPAIKARPAVSPKAEISAAGLQPANVIPGEVLLGEGHVVAFEGRPILTLKVANTGDRPIQVGSHCHFFEANRALQFDREKAYGFRLQVPAGTAVRFEPGEEKHVTLVAIGGNRVAYGINGLTNGRLDDPQVKARALARAAEQGFIQKGASQ